MAQDSISLALIAVFIFWEICEFYKTKKKIASYRDIFPSDKSNSHYYTIKVENGYNKNAQIYTDHKSELFHNIIGTINKYLDSNYGSISDYHLMKDVVDRNREVKESELETIIPFPQYIGLIGTMLGIFYGVGILVYDNGLDNLMSGKITALADSGITGLLGGVALAVLTSAVGIGLTMRSSYLFKEAKKAVESNENSFLGWIQAELLPNLTTDMSTALIEMTRNLSRFNETFAENTRKLDITLARVNTSYREQTRLIESIEQIGINKIVKANIEVYEKLKGCTDEIGMIAESLESSSEYLKQVRLLTNKLNKADERAKTWEKMGEFFNQEIKQFEKRRGFIAEAVGDVDRQLEKSFKHLQEQSDNGIKGFREHIIDQTKRLETAMNEQEQVLNTKLEQMQKSIDMRNENLSKVFTQIEVVAKTLPAEVNRYAKEFSNLTEIRRGIVDLKSAVSKTANEKKETVVVSDANFKLPLMIKIAIYVIAICCLIAIAKEFYPYVKEFMSNTKLLE